MQREWLETDYYAVLGVSPDATDKDISKAFRALARTHHPDQGGDEARFKEISAAHEVLGDAATRKEYDDVRRLGPMSGGFAGGPRGDGNYEVRFEDLGGFGGGGLGDILGGLFNRGDGGPAGATRTRPGPRPMPGADIEAELHLGFIDAVEGVTTEVYLGAEPIKVKIPAGVDHGQRIRVRGRGRPGVNGGPTGDLFVVVQVDAHPAFGRKGNDLTVTVPITFAEAVSGADVRVPTLSGDSVTLRIQPGTSSGKTFRVRKRGVERAGTTGDLLVTVQVAVPSITNDDQKAAVDAVAAAFTDDPRTALWAATTRED